MNQIPLKRLLLRLEKLHPKFIDLSLKRLLRLLKKLGDPHLNLPNVIHIAGTNGKGSTLSFIKQILIEHKYKVHCYISPHLESIQERFVISNKIISKKNLFNALKFIETINDNDPITFFEITTATAFYLFNKSHADFLILETGLGGRLDATNVIQNSIIDIITPISYDHEEYLGKTLNKITKEKLGIIKKNSCIIIGKQPMQVKNYISKKLKNKINKKIFYGNDYKILSVKNKKFSLSLDKKKINFFRPLLLGEYQVENAATAIAAMYHLKKLKIKINKKNINHAIKNTKWPARLEKVYKNNIPFLLDGAHNIAGAEQLAKFLIKNKKNTWIILGMLNTKNIRSFLLILKKHINGVIAIKIPDEKNTYTENEIYKICKKINIPCIKEKNINNAIKTLTKKIQPEMVLITGSLYLMGKIRKLFV